MSRQSVYITTVTRFSVKCKKYGRNNMALIPGSEMELTLIMLEDKTGPADQLEIPVAVMPKLSAVQLGDNVEICPNKVSYYVLEVPEAFYARVVRMKI